MPTLQSLINDAQTRKEMWESISNDPDALIDRGKSKKEALALASYFEGKMDGLIEARSYYLRFGR